MRASSSAISVLAILRSNSSIRSATCCRQRLGLSLDSHQPEMTKQHQQGAAAADDRVCRAIVDAIAGVEEGILTGFLVPSRLEVAGRRRRQSRPASQRPQRRAHLDRSPFPLSSPVVRCRPALGSNTVELLDLGRGEHRCGRALGVSRARAAFACGRDWGGWGG